MPVDPLAILTGLVLEDGSAWGDAADDVQLRDAAEVLTGSVPFYAISRARGYSKTTDLAGIVLAAALAAPVASRLYWAASDLDQGRLAIDSIAGFCRRTKALQSDDVEIGSRGVTIRATGTRIEILPADAPGAWGLRPFMVVADELAQWPQTDNAVRLWEALTSAMLKVKGARLVAISTAGSPTHWAAKVYEDARSDDLWRVSETRGPAPWTDPKMLEEQRRRLPAAVFDQLFENVWAEVSGSLLTPEDLARCFSLPGPTAEPSRSLRYCGGLDLGLKHDRTALAVGHRDGETFVLDEMRTWQGSKRKPVNLQDVEDAVLDLHKRYRFRRLLIDPWQGEHLTQRLHRAGLRGAELYNFGPASKQKLAQGLLTSVTEGRLALYRAEGLRSELAKLRLVQKASGAWQFDHQPGRRSHDDRAVALSLMIQAAVGGSSGGGRPFSVSWSPYTDVQGPSSFEQAYAEAIERRDDARRVHGAPGHRAWSMKNVCRQCYDEAPEREQERIVAATIARAEAARPEPEIRDYGYVTSRGTIPRPPEFPDQHTEGD